MISIVRTDFENQDFIGLVRFLDAYLAEKDGDQHSFYDQFNKIDKIKYVVMAYENEKPLGCGAIKPYGPTAMEVKRMYVSPESRKNGLATRILAELEHWATDLGYNQCVLETGKGQAEAIELYKRNGYEQIPNYAPYTSIENSLCFAKKLTNTRK